MGKIIGIVVALLVVAGAVYYFTSAVGRERMGSAWRQWAYWTPENIAKHPDLYLNFCEEDAKKSMEKLAAHEIAVRQNIARAKKEKIDAEASVAKSEKALGELRDVYNAPGFEWPAVWEGRRYDEAAFKRQAKLFDDDSRRNRKVADFYTGHLRKAEPDLDRIQDARAEYQTTLADIRARRTMLKGSQMSDSLREQLNDLKINLQGLSLGIPGADDPVVAPADYDPGTGGLDDAAFLDLMKRP